ncbi:MAG: DNA polymerase III subunit gamma/tau [Candidatus Brocadiia bacterium]
MYLVFARKYRPTQFSEVVGQEHVARTLQNAVREGKVAHAYLFCGSRGVGKTTMARILACALNCEKGPTPEPCGECDACKRIASGEDIDVMEIDGASNRLVEDIEQLRQNVKYAPARSRYKIYYIDEVHMLSDHAFNALLKTLEEPPEHVKFIFSTTDPQQLPETVKSRCQRFDFRRLSDLQIVDHLRGICSQEDLEVEDGALQLIARAARGSMRDALGTLDQVAAFGGKQVRSEDVRMVLGTARTQTLVEIVDALSDQQTGKALQKMHEVLLGGVDILDFADQISAYLRDLLVASYCGPEDDLLASAPADSETLERQAEAFSPDQILYLLQVFREAKLRARRDSTGRLAMELAIIKLSNTEDLLHLEEAIERLSGGDPQTEANPSTEKETAQKKSTGVSPQKKKKDSQSSRVASMMKKLQQKNPSGQRRISETEKMDLPEGIDRDTYKQIEVSAEKRTLANGLKNEDSLMQAFIQADKEFGLRPVQLRERQKKLDEQKQTGENTMEDDQ